MHDPLRDIPVIPRFTNLKPDEHVLTPAQQHAQAIRHWARADRGLRGQELREAADFIEQQAEALRLEKLACGCRWAMNDQRKEGNGHP